MNKSKYYVKPTITKEEYAALRKEARESKKEVNCFQQVVLELMNKRGLKDADIVKGTGIAASTWHDWISGDVQRQIVDERLLKVMKFFNVSLQYLCFKIGDPHPIFDADNPEK